MTEVDFCPYFSIVTIVNPKLLLFSIKQTAQVSAVTHMGLLFLLVVALSYYNNQDTLSEGKCKNKDNTNMIQEFYTVNTGKCLIWFLTPDFYRSDILYLNMNFHFQYKP